jgi:hypothetical protein
LTHDLARLADDAEAFRQRYEGKLAELSGAALGGAAGTYERLQEVGGRIISYASLVHAGNLADPESGRSGVGRTRNVVAPTSLAGQFEQVWRSKGRGGCPPRLRFSLTGVNISQSG